MRICMWAKIIMAAVVRLGRVTRTGPIATMPCPAGLVQRLFNNVNLAIVRSRIDGVIYHELV
jgi:hypothetical protein